MKSSKRKKIYLDYAASTPVDPRVMRAMAPYFSKQFGNPGSLHSFGQEAIAAVDASRESIAQKIGADFREIIFTSSATEANNLALKGIAQRATGQESGVTKPRIIISSIEHESILEAARNLEKEGVEVVYLPVDRHGIVDLKKLKESLTENVVLVSIMYANNEIGVVQPISEIAEIMGNFRNEIPDSRFPIPEKSPDRPTSRYPYFHVDAAQAFQFLDCNVQELGVDLMTLSAHKIYGPKGAGALYVSGVKSQESGFKNIKRLVGSRNLDLKPLTLDSLISGGGQEFGFRSGTENVAAIVGFAKAAGLISNSRELENKRIASLRDRLWEGIRKICPKAEANGGWHGADGMGRMANGKSNDAMCRLPSAISRLPNILNVYFPGHDAQDLLTRFDLNGLAASSGSACRSRAMESSHVIQALGYSRERAKSSIRFSLGRPTTKGEIDAALKIIEVRPR